MLYWLWDNFVCRKVVTLYLFELNFVSLYLVAIDTPVFLLQGRGTPMAPGTCAAFWVSDPFLSAPLAAPTGRSKTLVVLLASCSFQESCRLQEEFYGKHLIVGNGWTYTSTPSDQCNPLFTGIIWLYFLFTQGGLGGVLCTWYQKNSLLHLRAAHVLQPAHPLPRGLQQPFVRSVSTRGKHSTFSYECLSKQVIVPQWSSIHGQTFNGIPCFTMAIDEPAGVPSAEHG